MSRRKYKSKVSGAVHSTVAGMHRLGTVDAATLRRFDKICLQTEMSACISIRLPSLSGKRLEKLARHTGLTKSLFIREMILHAIDDIEDYYLSAQRAARIREGKETVIDSEKLRKDLGVGRRTGG
jgi:RHH-type transcriptional regulator, rel operon repressor / antitoxin RelB